MHPVLTFTRLCNTKVSLEVLSGLHHHLGGLPAADGHSVNFSTLMTHSVSHKMIAESLGPSSSKIIPNKIFNNWRWYYCCLFTRRNHHALLTSRLMLKLHPVGNSCGELIITLQSTTYVYLCRFNAPRLSIT